MDILHPALLLAMLSLFFGCQNVSPTLPAGGSELRANHSLQVSKTDYERFRNGKIKNAPPLPAVFTKDSLDLLEFPEIDDELVLALQHQLRVLKLRKQRKLQRLAGLDASYEKLEKTIQLLLDRAYAKPTDLQYYLDAYQTWGKDKRGHVKFTGYYTPVLEVKKEADATYKYPLYSFPKNWEGHLPTRQEIDGKKALAGLGLELAYAKDPVDIYFMQVQGSGYVRFLDTGERRLFRFAGDNGYRFRPIEKIILANEDIDAKNVSVKGIKRFLKKNPHWRDTVLNSNPSYVFFQSKNSVAKGAGGVPLMEGISIAVDSRYFPMGSVILASVPVYDRYDNISHHEFRVLLPQDVGGAVRGPGHVDVYSGVGNSGREAAGMLHHYGRMWLLLPKENKQLALNDEEL